jgi:hypothetical protein
MIEEMPSLKTLTIRKRGRLYFACTREGKHAKLIINDVSKNLDIGTTVTVEVRDVSRYGELGLCGVIYIYEPLRLLTEEEARALRQTANTRKEQEWWITCAHRDIEDGKYESESIERALRICETDIALHRHIRVLLDGVRKNRRAYEETSDRYRVSRYTAPVQQQKSRILYPVESLPPMNTPVVLNGAVVVFESRGKTFNIEDDDADEVAPWYATPLQGMVRDKENRGCYCYYRPATDREIAALETEEQDSL